MGLAFLQRGPARCGRGLSGPLADEQAQAPVPRLCAQGLRPLLGVTLCPLGSRQPHALPPSPGLPADHLGVCVPRVAEVTRPQGPLGAGLGHVPSPSQPAGCVGEPWWEAAGRGCGSRPLSLTLGPWGSAQSGHLVFPGAGDSL